RRRSCRQGNSRHRTQYTIREGARRTGCRTASRPRTPVDNSGTPYGSPPPNDRGVGTSQCTEAARVSPASGRSSADPGTRTGDEPCLEPDGYEVLALNGGPYALHDDEARPRGAHERMSASPARVYPERSPR